MRGERVTLDKLNQMHAGTCEAVLKQCCGSAQWARRVALERPFRDLAALLSAGDRVWHSLTPHDWLEAFHRHPRIGEPKAPDAASPREQSWSSTEQSGMSSTDAEARSAIAHLNIEYERRFGYIFLINATGRTAEEILAALRQRLENPPEAELRIAAAEQAAITRLRLEKLVTRD